MPSLISVSLGSRVYFCARGIALNQIEKDRVMDSLGNGQIELAIGLSHVC
ncbi:MAG: hypothetical protein CLLPBCKN_007714 [Chroococcidiopsis cubana SAG 39.79]|nr:hypothetical protein [Chroococcidiopsis cubana SAG 39.79]